MSLRTFSGVSPCGNGLPSGSRPKSERLEGRGWRFCSFVKASWGSMGGGGGVSRRLAFVREPERVAWIACCRWVSLGGVAVRGLGEIGGDRVDQSDSHWPCWKVVIAFETYCLLFVCLCGR